MVVLGTCTHLYFHIGGFITTIAGALILYQMLSCVTAREKLPWFAALAFLKGASIGGLVEFALEVDSGIVATAFSATALIFTCFSLAALLTTRRSMLYLGGILGSALSAMAILSLGNIFFQSQAVYNLNIYGGLLVFSGYVVVDTQIIVEKATLGYTDYVGSATDLLLDLVSIFIRVVMILLRGSSSRIRRNRNRDSRERK
jgi:FtsH-binding integral membrane protein